MLDDIFIIQNPGKRGVLKRQWDPHWVEDSFVEEYSSRNSRGEVAFLGTSLEGRRVLGFAMLVFLLLTGLWFRCIYLQVVRGDEFFAMAERNRIQEYKIPSNRGVIYDRGGEALVLNVPRFAVYVIPADLPRSQEERDTIYREIFRYVSDRETLFFESWKADLERRLDPLLGYSYDPLLVEDVLNEDRAFLLRILSQKYSGLLVRIGQLRDYQLEWKGRPVLSLSHLMGYLGRLGDGELADPDIRSYYERDALIGKSGLELSYESLLRGTLGKSIVEVDSQGKPTKTVFSEAPVSGSNIYLSLDLPLQSFIENWIVDNLYPKGLKRVSVIVEDPNNGGILSLVSLPGYNADSFSRGIRQSEYQALLADKNNPLFARAMAGEYPSGSTFKPLVALAALEEGVITFGTLVTSTGGIRIGDWFFPDWKIGGHGTISVVGALADSVNTFFYLAGGGDQNKFVGLGVDRLVAYARKFGLASPTGIDLPGEQTGFLPSPEWKEQAKQEPWYIGDTYHLAIGQGDLLVTPLQVAHYTATVAMGGKSFTPHLVEKYVDTEGNWTRPFLGKETAVSIDPSHWKTVQLGMRRVVTAGSARSLASNPMNIAGKTGTAQWQTDKANHAWFTSFAPYEKPEIVVTVLVEESGEGSAVAVPVADAIYRWWYEHRKF
ncbi:MAG: penicillin-binding protein 2 [Parcubacteria group bacterium Gr01-1014_18]|nr:MAG: penicillin-binding protein 2 [Parcubacteria group bacterium Greene0416_36]TSC81519.1 MAG: penicillin-binding protein 2 [Parcubacteria group bacterium Gr01-1014_18]TSC99670.1 MAG: penicillin-binding protein 2 [Parcubacteria group bacterium Greene1014_20]TSD07121.1 MAG: penicillin-binding protein 2 [Parcubacteria group bacterium Greene0714_2]